MAFKVNHLHFKTPDPRKTAKWYVDFLGAKIISERETPGGQPFFRLDLHGLALNVSGFLEGQQLEQHYGMEHLAIDTDDFAAEVVKIKAGGARILEERKGMEGRNICFFEGPEGVRLEFLEMKK
jgi:catechol 2,3-dioxygenase-like lactoylglutathione lyase family enzyme